MAKNNEYVGVDEKYVPEVEQRKTHVQEPIIGSENAQKIRDGITGGVNKLTSNEGKEKVKEGAKKGWKIAKGVGIGYLVFFCIVAILSISIFVFAIVGFMNTAKDNLDLHNGVNWRIDVTDDLEKIYTNNKTGEHLITVVNGDTSTTEPQQIRALANSIEEDIMSGKYDITIEYGDDGHIKTYTFEKF